MCKWVWSGYPRLIRTTFARLKSSVILIFFFFFKNGRIFVENSIIAEWHIYISNNVQTLNSTPSRKVPFSIGTFSLLLLKSGKVATLIKLAHEFISNVAFVRSVAWLEPIISQFTSFKSVIGNHSFILNYFWVIKCDNFFFFHTLRNLQTWFYSGLLQVLLNLSCSAMPNGEPSAHTLHTFTHGLSF